MRPIPLNNPWPERRRKFLIATLLVVVSVERTRPNSLTGLAIALVTIPSLCISLFYLRWWWKRKFGGSKLMTLIGLMLAIIIGIVAFSINDALAPYIGHHFG